jgi:hypothetical protein
MSCVEKPDRPLRAGLLLRALDLPQCRELAGTLSLLSGSGASTYQPILAALTERRGEVLRPLRLGPPLQQLAKAGSGDHTPTPGAPSGPLCAARCSPSASSPSSACGSQRRISSRAQAFGAPSGIRHSKASRPSRQGSFVTRDPMPASPRCSRHVLAASRHAAPMLQAPCALFQPVEFLRFVVGCRPRASEEGWSN